MGTPSRIAPRAVLLSIGSELLLGETVDTNAAFLGRRLAELGLELTGTRALPDDRDVLADAFRGARASADLVLATGGLGPTHDDLTREALAAAVEEELASDPALEQLLVTRFAAMGRMPQTNLRQALRVASAQIVPNPIGSAPGWWLDRDGCVVALMPGVPSEMRRMFDDELAPRIAARFALAPLHVRTVKTFGMGESGVAELAGRLLEAPPAGVTAGIYARDDGVQLRFSTHDDPGLLEGPAGAAASVLGEYVWGTDDDDLATVALAALARAGCRTVASRETDTQGALLAILAAAPVRDDCARFVGGLLEAGDGVSPPEADASADAVIRLWLLPQDANGRSRVRVSLGGRVSLPVAELRIHGSGPQRLRRAAFAALDHVRRGVG